MLETILTPVLWLAATGLLCGLALAICAKFFAVKEDPRITKIASLLPGANCGGCGYAGCAGYAAAIVAGKAPLGKCTACSDMSAIAEVMGMSAPDGEVVPKMAVVLCRGTKNFAKRSFIYDGIVDCAAANAVAGGDKMCRFGCLGYGSCVRVCPTHAISVVDGVARVSPRLCIGCGKCASVCPRHVIELVPKNRTIHVFCRSTDPGAQVRKYCSSGCIGCRICAKKAPDAMLFDGSLAKVNYDIPFPRCDAISECPKKCLGEISEK